MTKTIIIGGGPAGLAAAHELAKNNDSSLLLEQGDRLGGIARTESYRGYYFDLGGHRFFSKSAEINQLWQEIMGDDFMLRSRLSRIYYQQKFFNYPLKPLNALLGLGLWESGRILVSYAAQKLHPYPKEDSFEEWVSNRFGKRLYEIFFKSYTEKVWGRSCREIGAEWAAQRIKGLSLTSVILNAFGIGGREKVKTLIDQFNYPKYGPGMLWDRMAAEIKDRGGEIKFNSAVGRVKCQAQTVKSVILEDATEITGGQFVSSVPLRELILCLEPSAPETILEAARRLQYRSFLTVILMIDKEQMFPDNWIYIHSPDVKLGRVQNFKNWSPCMVPDLRKTCLGLEYFCDYKDVLWKMPDADLIELGKKELVRIGLLDNPSKVTAGLVCRLKNAYPVYDQNYVAALHKIRQYLSTFSNLQTIGRGGMHRYNNMDHSMLTGIYAARNVLQGRPRYDLWSVNADEEYHEQ